MGAYDAILNAAHDVVLHNWPIEDVPDTLTRAGYSVTVYGGPAPDDIFMNEIRDDALVTTKTGVPPERADLVYVLPWPGFVLHEDLPKVAADARRMGATTLWFQSGQASAGGNDPKGCWLADAEAADVRRIVEAAGLRCVDDRYIADAVREAVAARGA